MHTHSAHARANLISVPFISVAIISMAILASVLAAGCAPRITFAAHPRYVCSGMSTTLQWDTVGDTTLLAEPAVGLLGSVPNKGERRIPLNQTTMFTMTVHRGGKNTLARQEVTFIETSQPHRIQVDPKSCEGGAVIFEADVPTATWPEVVRVADIALSAPLANALVLEHATKTATIAAGQTTSTALRDTPITGKWRAILKTRNCEDAPDALVLPTTLSCSQ